MKLLRALSLFFTFAVAAVEFCHSLQAFSVKQQPHDTTEPQWLELSLSAARNCFPGVMPAFVYVEV